MRFTLLALIVISCAALLGTGTTIGVVDYFAGDLPSIDAIQTANLSQTTRILDRNGKLIEALYHENRTVVPLGKISPKLQAATITQQVVKNDVLDTEEAQSRTVSRKFRELLLAEEMERRYTKQQILELYLNTINYGNGAYGVEAAAETYFQVHATDLTLAQASFLAGLPQAPTEYDPFGTPDQLAAAKDRWGQVLDGMVTVGDVSSAAAHAAYNSDLLDKMIAAHKAQPGSHNPVTAHFVDYVERYIAQRYGTRALYEGGLMIYTTLDLPTQAVADKWVKSGVATYAKRGVNTGAMLVMNPNDGEILAMVGSADYNNAAIRGQINLTGVDPLGWRGVGSSFKVYTYGAALQAGLVTPASPVNDQTRGIGGGTPQQPGAQHQGEKSPPRS